MLWTGCTGIRPLVLTVPGTVMSKSRSQHRGGAGPIYEVLIPMLARSPEAIPQEAPGPAFTQTLGSTEEPQWCFFLLPVLTWTNFYLLYPSGKGGCWQDCPHGSLVRDSGSNFFPSSPHSCPLPCSVVLFEHLYLMTMSLSSQHVHPRLTPTTSRVWNFMRVP